MASSSTAPLLSSPPSKRRKIQWSDIAGAGVEAVTGVPGTGELFRAAFPERREPRSIMKGYGDGQLAPVRNTGFKYKGRKYRKTARIAKSISNLSAVHEWRSITSQRNAVAVWGRQTYAELGYDGPGSNPSYGGAGAQIGLLNVSDLVQVQQIISGLAYGSNVGNLGYRFVINKAIADYEITNSTNGNVKIMLYDFVPRRDIVNQANTNVYPPNLAWYAGMTSSFQSSNVTQAASVQFASTDPATYLGSTPFDSSLFCSQYKVLAKRSKCLAPGVCFVHTVKAYPRKVFTDTMWTVASVTNNASTDVTLLAKTTVLTMMVLEGMPGHDTTGLGVTTSEPAVDIITKKRYYFSYGPAPQRSLKIFSDIPTTITGNFQSVPEAQGAFSTVVNH